MDVNAVYVVWSNEHSSWWGPDHRGYVWHLTNAGRYTREEALKICRNARGGREFNRNPSELPILLADAEVYWPDADIEKQEKATKERQKREAAWDALDDDGDYGVSHI